jgi:hypothetical protein
MNVYGERWKVQFSLCLIKNHALKAYGEWKYLASDADEWRSGRFAPTEGAQHMHWMGWLDLRARLDAVEQTQISCCCRESNCGRPTRFCTSCVIPASIFVGVKIDFQTFLT